MDDGRLSSKLENFEELERKKRLILVMMLKDGYKESDVIPIATNQAEKWYEHASKEELETLKTNISRNIKKMNQLIPKLNEENVHVYYEDQLWKVKSKRLDELQIHLTQNLKQLTVHNISQRIKVPK